MARSTATSLATSSLQTRTALKQLEDIIHPYVRQAIDILAKRASQKVIVIEAIKLLEVGLAQLNAMRSGSPMHRRTSRSNA